MHNMNLCLYGSFLDLVLYNEALSTAQLPSLNVPQATSTPSALVPHPFWDIRITCLKNKITFENKK